MNIIAFKDFERQNKCISCWTLTDELGRKKKMTPWGNPKIKGPFISGCSLADSRPQLKRALNSPPVNLFYLQSDTRFGFSLGICNKRKLVMLQRMLALPGVKRPCPFWLRHAMLCALTADCFFDSVQWTFRK